MISADRLRALYLTRTKGGPRGRIHFLNEMRHSLGLCNERGVNHSNRHGRQILAEESKRKFSPEVMNFHLLAEAIIGPGWQKHFDPSRNTETMHRMAQQRSMIAQKHGTGALLEATGVGVDATSFLNINTFSALVGGLVEVKVLEGFENPAFIADQLMPAVPTKLNGQKIIGTTNIGDAAKKRKMGDPHERTQFSERWVITPETRENALAIDILKETVFFDLTGEILDQASTIGEALAYRKELECIDMYIGSTANFNYMGVGSLSPYSTSATPPAGLDAAGKNLASWYSNDNASNDLLDWTNLQTSMLMFSRLLDPHTGKRILTAPDTIVVNPGKLALANLILNAQQTEIRSGTTAGDTQNTAAQLNVIRSNGTPYGKEQFKVLTSPLIEQRLTDSAALGGQGLSVTNATKRWYVHQNGKAFKYMQNWPLSVTQAPPQQYDMLDKGIVASYFANERGIPAIASPWHVQRNQG